MGWQDRDWRPMSASRSRQIRVEGAVLAGFMAFGSALVFGFAIGGFDVLPSARPALL